VVVLLKKKEDIVMLLKKQKLDMAKGNASFRKWDRQDKIRVQYRERKYKSQE